MILFLTSSPCLEDSPDINPANHFIVELQRSIKYNAKLLFVSALPSDPDFSEYCAFSLADGLENAGLQFADCMILDDRTADDARELVSRSDVIILGGGHVPTQNAFLKRLRMRALLSKYRGVIMGISAGSMNCADTVYAQPEEDGESLDPHYRRFMPGLSLTKRQILPHYNKVWNNILDGQRLYEDITFKDSIGHTFYVLPDGSYILAKNGKETLCGEAWRIQNGSMTKICEEGQRLAL